MSARRALPAAVFAATVAFICLQAPVLGQTGREAVVTQTPPAKTRVLVKDNYFEPRSAEVLEGGQVSWKWKGHNRHSIRFTKVPDGTSRKGAKARVEGHWKRVFLRPGVYRYVCRFWAGMRGTVNVRPEPAPQPEQ